MADIQPDKRPNPALSHVARALLLRLVSGERVPLPEPGMDELVGLGLAHKNAILGVYTASDFRHAELTYTERAYDDVIDALRRAGQMAHLVREFETLPSAAGGGFEVMSVHQDVTVQTTKALDGATTIVRAAHPLTRRQEILERSIVHDLESLERGIERQTIYLESARLRAEERAYAAKFSAAGGQVRTALLPFERMIIVDDRVAFISDHAGDPDKKPGINITHPSLVAFLVRVFHQQWENATPWMGEAPAVPAGVTTPRTRRMLDRMVEGVPLKSIAKELDVSLSTVHADLKRIYSVLVIKSQMALGAWWLSDASAAERAQDPGQGEPDLPE
ncbi:LuxR C-terminal-related transcriptional regulator [Streptomyces sp. NPDC050804]|uniref:LuxR C-terminal-related transcriptional regulator n=1 Tax=Streptomyces sp. NPDC050804 TaxID=3154745 RepID=UPI00341937ED